MRKTEILILLVACICSAWFTTLVDDGLGEGWAHTAVRNWDEYGLIALHGKMVSNPGGFQADTNPDCYLGHRPASLYPVFLCHKLLAGSDLGFLLYYAIMAAIVLWSIWFLLGRTDRAFWLAAVAVVTPGYIRWQTTLDPNLTAVLFGFPFCAAVISLLRRPSLKSWQVILLVVLILLYSSINWTTVFIHGMLFTTLLVLSGVPRRQLVLYGGVTAVCGCAVLFASVASKMSAAGHDHAQTASMPQVFQMYGWGTTGYGVGMTTRIAVTRLLVANLLGLFPILVFLGWTWLRECDWSSCLRGLFFLPLLASVVEVLGMRNYFGHHPWMSVSFILLGIILTIVVLQAGVPVAADRGMPRVRLRLAWFAAAAAYCFLVMDVGRIHNAREMALAGFIREHTARAATIVIHRDTDSELADLAPRLASLFDRHVVVTGGSADPTNEAVQALVLTTRTNLFPEKILAQTTLANSVSPAVKELLNLYTRHVARRRAGDQMALSSANYSLYSVGN